MAKKRQGAAEVFRQQNVMQEKRKAAPARRAMERKLDVLDNLSEEEAAMGDIDFDEQIQMASAGLGAPAPTTRRPGRADSPAAPSPEPMFDGFKTSEELQIEKEPIRVRETGMWPLKRIVVPPNVYVVHTRSGRKKPVTLGLGLSFRYNPLTDAYLVVPAAMQTIGVVANCISKEKQGINVLAYVQWQIHDFSIAYRKLDFSDSRDPLAIVNAQLREQAEAAIKDKIVTMSIEEVLADKEPIIEELTTRLKAVAEGRNQEGVGDSDRGLGIKIVTVQIKEAFVSSQTLWENLQAPFRHEQQTKAHISELNMQDEIHQKELETRRLAETSQAETMVEIERTKQTKQTEALQLRLQEEATRFSREQENTREKTRLQEETTLFQRESEQRLIVQQAQVEQESAREKTRLQEETTLFQRESDQRLVVQQAQVQQEWEIEQTRMASEASVRQKQLAVEQALGELAEEARLAAAELEARRAALERQTELTGLEADFNLLVQSQSDQFEAAVQEADLNRQQQSNQARLAMQQESNRVKIAYLQQQAEVERLQQQIRNLVNENALSNRLIEQLPELAESLPEVNELRVLQTGGDNGGYNALASFLSQVRWMADSLGISLGDGKNDPSKPADG